jgi:hydrogenase maturation protease
MQPQPTPCLILACGNTLREDDGIGPHLAHWATEHWSSDPRIRVISCQQWTPDLAVDIAAAHSVIFLDCSIDAAPGHVDLQPVQPAASQFTLATHHSSAPSLLALARDLYNATPHTALLLTIGAYSLELGDVLSGTVQAALPRATALLRSTVNNLLNAPEAPRSPHSA